MKVKSNTLLLNKERKFFYTSKKNCSTLKLRDFSLFFIYYIHLWTDFNKKNQWMLTLRNIVLVCQEHTDRRRKHTKFFYISQKDVKLVNYGILAFLISSTFIYELILIEKNLWMLTLRSIVLVCQEHTDRRRKHTCGYCSKSWERASDLAKHIRYK